MSIDLEVAWIGVVGAAIGGLISSGTTWLLARNERYKFARERTWEVRREAYTNIIARIVAAEGWAKLVNDGYSHDPHAYDQSQQCRKDLAELANHVQAAKREFTANRLMLSADFVMAFARMMFELEAQSKTPGLAPPETAEEVLSILDKGTVRLLEIGTKETVTDHSSP